MLRSKIRKTYCYNEDGSLYKIFDGMQEITAEFGKLNLLGAFNKRKKIKGKFWSYIHYTNYHTREKAPKKKKQKQPLSCPNCGSFNYIRFSSSVRTRRGETIRLKCKDCGHRFSDYANDFKRKRLLFIGDLHCGHLTGLTPPEFNTGDDRFFELRKRAWQWFSSMVQRMKPIDILIVNADAIDGRGEKNGGEDAFILNRITQTDMAIRCINEVEADKVYMTRGSRYHVGNKENWEDIIAKKTGAEIYNILKIEVNGCKIRAKHKIGRSSIPHGRFTQLALKALWEDLKIVGTDAEKVNLMCFSHVHYFSAIQLVNRIVFTTPALQVNSDYGERECDGIIDFGIVYVEIDAYGTIDKFKPITTQIDEKSNNYIKVY